MTVGITCGSHLDDPMFPELMFDSRSGVGYLAMWISTEGSVVEGCGLILQHRETWVPLFDLLDSDRFGGR